MNIRVLLVKIQSHSEILGNDIADKEAKRVARQDICLKERLLYLMKAYCRLVKLTECLMLLINPGNYTGIMNPQVDSRYTYNLIPTCGTKVTFSKVRHVDIAYCRMLLHDTMLMKDGFRSGRPTSDTPVRHCGKAEESVEHFLLHCGNYVNDRKVLLDTVMDLAVSRSSEQSLRITKELLLAPTYDDIRKRNMLFIKEALSSL